MPQNAPRQTVKKKRSKAYYRKRRMRRLIVLFGGILVVLLLVTAVWQLVVKPIRAHQERVRQESISISESIQRQSDYSEAMAMIQNAAPVNDIDESVLNALKTQALAGYTTAADGEISRVADKESASDQAVYFLEHLSAYDHDILAFYLNNPERFEFVKAWPDRASLQTPPAQLTESLNEVPHLLQWDTRWGYEPYGDSTIYLAGCAPTSLSMVLSYLKKDASITPAVIKSYAEQNGYYVSGAGTAHSLLSDYPAIAGVNAEQLYVDQEMISQALKEGKVLIFNMVPGLFTQTGHFIVVTGEEDGQLKVLDPNSNSRSRLWSYEQVLPETAAVWAYSA